MQINLTTNSRSGLFLILKFVPAKSHYIPDPTSCHMTKSVLFDWNTEIHLQFTEIVGVPDMVPSKVIN